MLAKLRQVWTQRVPFQCSTRVFDAPVLTLKS
jgi:hypothetical protein